MNSVDPARAALEAAMGGRVFRTSQLAAGNTGDVLKVVPEGGDALVAKLDPSGDGGLEVEARSLGLLRAAGAPTPRVERASPHVLLMEWRPGTTGVSDGAAEDAARVLVELHGAAEGPFGLDHDTRIGGLVQSNAPSDSWLAFFAEHRLVGPARAAHTEGRLGAADVTLIERVAARLSGFADEPDRPALLHGDLWAGNVLTTDSELSALIDPSPYRGHAEVDLAFATMFGGFPRHFFDAYRERATDFDRTNLNGDFWSERRELWNLYPLLIHARLFGGGYVADLLRCARRFG